MLKILGSFLFVGAMMTWMSKPAVAIPGAPGPTSRVCEGYSCQSLYPDTEAQQPGEQYGSEKAVSDRVTKLRDCYPSGDLMCCTRQITCGTRWLFNSSADCAAGRGSYANIPYTVTDAVAGVGPGRACPSGSS